MILLYLTKEIQEYSLIQLYISPNEVNLARLAFSQSVKHLTIGFLKQMFILSWLNLKLIRACFLVREREICNLQIRCKFSPGVELSVFRLLRGRIDYFSLTGLFQFFSFCEFLLKTEGFSSFAYIKEIFKVLTLSSVFGWDWLLKSFLHRSLAYMEGRAGSAAGSTIAATQPQQFGITNWHIACWFVRLRWAEGSSKIRKDRSTWKK